MDLDLGSSIVFNVKVNGGEYKMTAPTVMQAQSFQEKCKDNEGEELPIFLNFIVDLGMPKDVAKKLDVVQLRKLSEGLMDISKKNR
jgi:hypothetical protein